MNQYADILYPNMAMKGVALVTANQIDCKQTVKQTVGSRSDDSRGCDLYSYKSQFTSHNTFHQTSTIVREVSDNII